jgi:hypothetical protein
MTQPIDDERTNRRQQIAIMKKRRDEMWQALLALEEQGHSPQHHFHEAQEALANLRRDLATADEWIAQMELLADTE